MKHYIYFLLTLLVCLLAGQVTAQYTPFVGANTIILSTFLADQQAYEAITVALMEDSLTFIPDGDRLLIRSQSKSAFTVKGLLFEGQITLNAGVVKLTGHVIESPKAHDTSLSAQNTRIIFAKGRNSNQRLAFSYMDALAKKLQSSLRGTLTYKYQADAI